MVANLIYKNQKFYNLTVVELSVEPPLYAYAKGFIYYNTLTGKFGINTGKRWDYSVQIIDNNGLVQGPQGPQGEPGLPAEMPFVELSQTSSTSEWTGTAYIPGFTSLYDGLTIRCFLPYNSTNTPVTLSLAVDTGNNIISPTTLPVYWLYPERLTTQVAQYAVFTLTYRQSVDGTGDGMWLCEYDKVGTGDVTGNNLTDNNLILGNGGKSIKASSYQVQPQGASASSWIGTDGYIPTEALISAYFQPLDADLTAIAALTGTTGFLVKTAADTWELDTNTYVTMSGMQIYLAANYVSQSSLATTLSDYVLATDLADTLDSYALKSSLARVATTGSYTDLINKPQTFTPSPHTHPWGQVTVKPTTLRGYAISDAKIENGTITLGTNSITPLTQHQSLADYITQTQLNTALAGYDPMYGTSSGSYSHAIGRASTASGQYALALAYNSTASANYAVALGTGAVASAASAFALGNSSVASAIYAVSFGGNSVASGQYSLATGRASYAMSASAVVTATSQATNIATETLSSAISNSRTYTSTVTSDLSVGMVVLDSADVRTPLAVITGINRTNDVITLSNTITVASGVTLAYRRGNAYNTASVAEGYQTASIGGYGSHAEGRYTTAQGQASHAEGWGTWASVAYQHAVGKWNATGNFAEVVGNGTSETQRSNIRTLDWNGNEWVAGNITAGGYIDATAIKIGGTIINVANAWMQGTATASNVIWVETSGTDYILHIGNTSITVSATGTATSIAWSGITGIPATVTSLGTLAGTTTYGLLRLSSTNTLTVDTTSYALASHTHTISEITDFPSLAAVALSGRYTDLDDKPTIPTVNDGVLTLQLNNGTQTNSVTFSANSSTDQIFSVDLSSYLTSHQSIYALNLSAGTYESGSTTYSPTTAALSICIPTTSDHIAEGNSNLFFTDARAVAALSTTLSAYMLASNFTETNVYDLFSNARKYALDSRITVVKVDNYDTHLANTDIHITASERTAWNSAYTATQSATSANIANRIVKRDANGDFAARQITATLIGNADTATTATKLGTETKGGIKQPIYLDAGSPTAITETVGSATQPMYLNNGVMTATTFSLNKTVPADAVFSYSAGTGLKLTSTTFAVDYGSIASGNNKPVSGGTIFTKLADYALISTLKNVAFSGSYIDLINKPAINDGTLTLKINGTQVATFSANSSSNVEFNVNTSGGGGGSVTSVAMTVPTGFTINGSPITSEGTLALGFANDYSLPTNTNQNLWSQAYNDTLAATENNTPSTIVKRDASGNFAAGTITANLTGTASEATKLGHTTVGSGVKFIYLDRGEAKASASSLGGANQPIWLDNGQLKQCNTFAPASHYQAWSTITDTPTTLVGYGLQDDAYTKTQANNVFAYKLHTHTVSDITDFPTLADVATSGLYSDLDGIPETFAPSAHSHNWSDILPASRPTTLAGYGLQDDAYITPEQDGYVTIRLGENSVVIDTSGTVSSVDWVAINNKPPIIAGPNGLASLSGTTTYGILKLTGTNEIQVDTTNYANQNAWSNVKVGNTTVAAGTTTDTLTLVAGSNVTLTPNATNKSITLAATDTTYDEATQTVHGLMSADDKTKLDGIAAGANNYSLPTADDNTLGGVKTGYTPTLDKYYAVKVDASGNMYVHVPWSGGTYELPTADDNTLGGVKTGYSAPSTPSNRYYAVDLDVNDKMFVEVPWENTTYNDATQLVHGLMSTADKTKLDGIAANANNYSLPTASDSTLGGVKIGYIDNEKNYRVQLDNDNRMFVTVDWQNTVYTLPEATSVALGGVKIGYESQDNQDYPVQLDTNGKMFVSVPWTDTPYLLPLATGETRGGVKIGYTTDQSQRKYAVQLDNEMMYVEVPWTDTTYQRANDSTFGLVKIGYTTNDKNYKVELNPSGQMFVNVPWTDTNTTYSAGTGLTLNNNNTFAVEFGTITNGGTKAVTGGAIYSELQTKPNYTMFAAGQLIIAYNATTLLSSNYYPKDSTTPWDANNDYYLPTMKGISAYVTGLGYTSNTGTVTSLTFQAGSGINVSPTTQITTSATVTITNTGVLSVSESRINGNIRINTGGAGSEVPVHGLGGAAYMAEDYYAEASHTQDWDTITDTPTTLAGYGITNAYRKNETYNRNETYSRTEIATYFAAKTHTHDWSDIISGKPSSLSGYGITNAYTKAEVNNLLSNIYTKAEVNALLSNLGVMTFKGSVPTVSDLPNNASTGDMYVVNATGTPYVWDGSNWVALTLIDLSDYVTQSQIANMVWSTYDISAGNIVIGHDDTKRVISSGKSILSSYSSPTDFTGVEAASVVPTASVIHSYLNAAYQPIGQYLTQSDLAGYATVAYVEDNYVSTATFNTTLSGYATKAYVDGNFVTTSALNTTLLSYVTTNALSDALQDMVTISANLLSGNIVTASGSQTVTNSGVRILKSTSLWNSVDSYVPTTALTDKRYPINGGMDTGYLVVVSSKTQTTATVTANTYQPHSYSAGTTVTNWVGTNAYIPTELMIQRHILDDMIGNTLQGYSSELTLLADVNKSNLTGYMYWNGSSYELVEASVGGSDIVKKQEGVLTRGQIIVGDGGQYVRACGSYISVIGVWTEDSVNIATIGNTMGYLSANYQPLATNLTQIAELTNGSGYLYYNGTSWSFSTPSGTGNVTAASTLTNGKLVTGVGDFGIATTNFAVASSGGGSPRTTWDDTSDVYVPTMASIYGRLVALATLTFAAGAFSAKTYNPSGSAKTINIPTNTSHLTDGGNIVMWSDLSNYVTYEQGDIRYLLRSGGNMSGTIGSRNIIPVANNQYDLGSSSYKYNNLYCAYINPIEIHHTSNLTGITFGNESLQLWAYTDSTPREQARISLWAGDGQDRPEVRLYGNIGAWGSTSQDKAIGTSSHPFSAIYLKAYHKTIKITVTDNGGIITDVLD